MPLITKADVQGVRKISTTFDQNRFDTFAQAAQDHNLRIWLGDALYNDLEQNHTDAKYVTLLDGEQYEKDGKTIKFYGLKKYLSYAWLFINAVEGDDFQSNIGTVNFNQEHTSHPKTKSATRNLYQDTMIIYKNNAIDYLNEKSAIYTLWDGYGKDKRGKFDFMII